MHTRTFLVLITKKKNKINVKTKKKLFNLKKTALTHDEHDITKRVVWRI